MSNNKRNKWYAEQSIITMHGRSNSNDMINFENSMCKGIHREDSHGINYSFIKIISEWIPLHRGNIKM